MKRLETLFAASPRQLPRRAEIAIALGLVGLGLALRLATAGQDSLWVDEGYTLATSRVPTWQLWTVPLDVHPPLFYTLVKPFLAFGASEFTLRLLSVMASTLALVPLYFLARWLLGNVGALTALAVSSLSFTHLVYANNARNYALLLLLFFTLFAALYQVTRHLLDQRPAADKTLLGWAAVYVVAAIGALYTHNTAVFYIFWANVTWATFALFMAPRRLVPICLRFLIVNIPVVLAWIPWLLVILSTSEDFSWLQQASPGEAVRTLLAIILPNRATPPGLLVALAALVIGALAALSRNRALVAVAVFHIAVFPLFMWGFGFVYKPVFMERVILPALLGSALMTGAGVAYLRHARLAYGMAGLVVVASLVSSAAYILRPATEDNLGAHTVQDWRAGVSASLNDETDTALVLCSSFAYPTVSFYADDADIYVLRPDGALAAVDDATWQRIASLPVAERGNDFHAALDTHRTPDTPQTRDWTDLAQSYGAVAALRTDMFCEPEFIPFVTDALSDVGFTAADIRTYPGVIARSFSSQGG